MKTNVIILDWKVGERKQIDYPIECVDAEGNRIVVARVPITSKTDAESVAALVATSTRLLRTLIALKQAVEYTPLGIAGIKAVQQANEVIAEVRRKP